MSQTRSKTKQQQNKTTFTATKSQECLLTNRRQPTKLFWADWLHCIAYCCPIFLKYDSLPTCKGKPYLKLSKLILNWTVRKN